ncbi:putative MFS siderochrome iron transporter 1 [[Candida] jaroonii]|uniref:MFS siderochrome iron transporter 1 n=1 Tax=[Candida] jaroonii TaxID=467808 RepID=A0ACA9YFB1_9ASCO|nr:putative MFS siderochrome iron transporter 1 [[Candida] jaroonii]
MSELMKNEKSPPVVDVESLSTKNSTLQNDMVELEDGDIALTKKMHLINNALDEIGFTWFHFKYMIIAGYGYAAESLIGLAHSTVSLAINIQFHQSFSVTTEVSYVGLLLGSIFFGMTADIIGRKLAFNTTLLASSCFGFFVGGSSNYVMYLIFLMITSFFVGGNLAIDASVFLETLPSRYTWLVTFFACFWSFGQLVGYVVAYGFMVPEKWNGCTDFDAICDSAKNRGWRYTWYVDSGILLGLSLIRLFLQLDETPKYLIVNNQDEEAMKLLQKIATKYNRNLSLTLEQLQECGSVDKNKYSKKDPKIKDFFKAATSNLKYLFATKKMKWNTTLLLTSWFGIGIAYPLYGIFLPQYLAAKGATTSASTNLGIYSDAMMSNGLSAFGPVIGAALILTPKIGRKGALCIGGILSMVFLMCYTTVRTRAQNQAFTVVSYITIYIYYGVLYAFTPEVLPSYCRATGSGLCAVVCRIGGLIVPLIAYFSNTSTPVPIYVCAGCIGFLGIIALFFPFDPSKQRSV